MGKTKKNALLKISLVLTIISSSMVVGVIWIVTTYGNLQQEETVAVPDSQDGQEQVQTNPQPRPVDSLIQPLNPQYEISASLDTARIEVRGEMRILFDHPGTEEIFLYLYDYPSSPMEIIKISAGGRDLSYLRQQRIVKVENPYRKRERIEFVIQFRAPVPQTGTRFGYKNDVWLLTHWYPMLGVMDKNGNWFTPELPAAHGGDPFYYQHADYRITFTAPSNIQWVTSGAKREESSKNGYSETVWEAKNVLNFVLAGSTRYHIEQMTIGDTEISIALLREDMKDKVLTMIDYAFSIYTRLYGGLATPYVAVAETGPGTVFAMEYGNMAIYSVDMHAQNRVEHWLPHEIAHLWWYNSVSTLEPLYGWIDEGLAEASVVDYLRERYGEGRAEGKWRDYEYNWRQLQWGYPREILGKDLYQFKNYTEYRNAWYSKSALLFRHLQLQIGEEKYRQFLKLLNRKYVHTIVGPEHLDNALGEVMGGDVNYFLQNMKRTHREGLIDPETQP